MDPLQASAARYVSPVRKSEVEEIEAFYDTHAFAGWHKSRRALLLLVQMLRTVRGRRGGEAPTTPEIASTAGRA